jgi:hypothetical protein
MSSTNPEDNLTPAESETLDRLEAIAHDGLGAYVQVGDALTEIRDRQLYRDAYPSFEAYVRDRWGVEIPSGHPVSAEVATPPDTIAMPTAELPPLRTKPCEALAKACEQTIAALGNDERMVIEFQLAVRRQRERSGLADTPQVVEGVAQLIYDELVPALRWLLAQASGTIAEVGHQLESRAADIDDAAREQLRDDVFVLDEELETVKSLLVSFIDWDSDFGRLIQGEIPPRETDTDSEDDE